ncbi:MAG: primosomal protein N' [Phycisphaerae bacterium]|nr:primosomal protein N' [Phycisphaerae bacterium]
MATAQGATTADAAAAPTVRRGLIATVAPLAPIDQTYSYTVPDDLAERLRAGCRVRVRIGAARKPQLGFCTAISEGPWESTLRPIDSIEDDAPLLSPALLELGAWIARYYACPLGYTLHAMVPAGRRRGAGRRAVRYVRRLEGGTSRLTPRQARVLDVLASRGGTLALAELTKAAHCAAATIRTLAAAGHVEIEVRHETPEPAWYVGERHEPGFALNSDQAAAVRRIDDAVRAVRFVVLVLFGVTGSGKTECYVRGMRTAIESGRQVIMLVPEIALTTQTLQRLAQRFDRVAVIHSGLRDAERSRLWSAIADGRVSVVIGTRSAVFSPCPRPGLIIVDEEPEPSFKNQASPRYHTRDVAIKRGQLEGIPVVLGSATPSLETWRNVEQQPHYELIRLPRRVAGLPLPTVKLVDMREEHRSRPGVHLLSRMMEEHLQRVLERGEQAVLLLNRRGYASFLFCPRCRTPIVCPNCQVHMVFHSESNVALCHYCRERLVVPTRCAMAGCGGTLVRFGMGTQRVEAELRGKFPSMRLERLDSDAMKHPDDYARVLGEFEARRIDVLVGTQMIAKGLDFPFVSFVGIVSADTALGLPDFRAAERTFQLVLQVAGRSGRSDIGGQVVVQTFASDVSAIRRAVRHDYEGFAAEELRARQRVRWPPHSRLVRLVLSDARLSPLSREAEAVAQRCRAALARHGLSAEVLNPAPSPIARLRNRYRYDLLLRFPDGATMLRALDLLRAEGAWRAQVQSIIVDVDPVAFQ